MKGKVFCFIGLVAVALLFGCATTVPVKVMRPADFDFQGARSIAVLPFGFPSQLKTTKIDAWELAVARFWGVAGDPTEQQVAAYLGSAIQSAILDAQYYTVVSGKALEEYLRSPSGEPLAQAYLTGEITNLSSSDKDTSYSYKDKNGNMVWVEQYKREVVLAFRYDAIDSKTRMVFGSRDFRLTRDATSASIKALPTVERLAKEIIDAQVPGIVRQIQPTEETQYLELMGDKSKDPRMTQADKWVKDGFIAKAQALFAEVYAETENLAAGFNATLLKEALGDLEGAIADMQRLADKHAEKQALEEVRRMQAKKVQQDKAKAQAEKKR